MFSAKDLFFAKGPAGGYTIAKSLRFRSSASAYLSRTPGSAGNQRTWTFSFWVKRGKVSSGGNEIIGCYSASTDTGNFEARFTTGDQFQIVLWNYSATTTAVFRDPSAWYHCVLLLDTTQAGTTSGSKIKLYVNGVLQSWSSDTISSSIAQNTNLIWNSTTPQYVGRWYISDGGTYFLDGYIAETYFIDGQALTPSSFGQTDTATGVWMPKAYTGTYGTNGFYLQFTDVGATSGSNTGYGKDFSGNSNYWTTNNLSSTAGVTYDSMYDTPTNYDNLVTGAGNYAIWNPVDQSGCTIANGNLQTTVSTVPSSLVRASLSVTTGKWYWEITCGTQTSSAGMIGVTIASTPIASSTWTTANSWMYYGQGQKYNNNTGVAYGATYTTGDNIGVALDCDAGTLTFYKNGVSQGVAYNTGLTGLVLSPSLGNGTSGGTQAYDANFGQRPFTYTPPSGYKALCTQNLPTPTIGATSSTLANKYFDVSLYTGNASTLAVTNSGGFQPDFVWAKSRSVANNNILSDAVRGANAYLVSNATNTEGSSANVIASFNANGFTLGSDTTLNTNASSGVGWQWKANGSGSSNTSGSITSTVSANVTSGFSVVTYTGTGANATVGHGLGVAPKMVIVKNRSAGGAGYWLTWHTGMTSAGYYLALNLTSAQTADGTVWNSTAPTSSVFSIGTNTTSNNSGTTFVAYCFAEVAGYSKFGSYTGNASTDGTFVYTGFRPRYVLLKSSSAAGTGWYVYDSARNTYNVVDLYLRPDVSDAETTFTTMDFLSNGFKLRTTNSQFNGSGNTYIYAAFAENPFNYSRAR